MPLTAAEKQRKYREKLKNENPEKYKELMKKNSERTLRKYRQKVANYSEEQKEEMRENWRKARKSVPSTLQEANTNVNTTIGVGDGETDRNMQRREEYKGQSEVFKLRKTLNTVIKGFQTLNKKVRRQQKELEKMKKDYKTVMIKLKHEKPDLTLGSNIKQTSELTPMKRVSTFLNETIPNVETSKKEKIKKKLLEYELMKESFKSEYKNSSNKEKNTLKRIANNDVLKKYKQGTKLKRSLGVKRSSYKARREDQRKQQELEKKVISFYNRDDVSRITAGKKEYRTYKKIKWQKRYLLDSLKRLHKKYVAEEGELCLSAFKKYRPFYVLPAKINNCETCECMKHSNMQFIVDEMKSCGLLESNNLNDIVSDLVCDFKSRTCMYGDCTECSEKKIDAGDKDPETEVNWFVWALKEYEYGKPEDVKKSKKMMKIKKEGTLKELLEIFNKDVKTFKKHVFNFFYQYGQYKSCIKNLKHEEVIIHIDFSENYTCKLNKEVQAKHFVKDQITLHTGVIYLRNENPISFCSISPDNQHNPESIWAHLDPVLNFVKNAHPNVSVIHFFSDGPTTQYRQKKNFYLFSQNIYDYGFNCGTWNFFEAAHGKGAADGVGGAIKRTLDNKVAQGRDIPEAQAAYDALLATDTTIKVFYVPAESIKPLDELVVKNLKPLPGTMKIHQLTTCEKYKLKYRDLSCFCNDASGNCECYLPEYHDYTTSLLNKNNIQLKRKRQNRSETNKKIQEKSSIKKAKRLRKDSSSSTEEDTNIHIEYAESDASGFLSDISMSSDVSCDENTYELDENTGILRPRVDPNKKIQILSTVILQKAIKNSNEVSNTQIQTNLTKNRMKTSIQEHEHEMTGKYKANDNDGKKVTTLCEIRHSAENIGYFDLHTSKIFEDEGKVNVSEKENFEEYEKENVDKKLSLLTEQDGMTKPETVSDNKIKTNENKGKQMEKTDNLDECKIKKNEKLRGLTEEDETEIPKTLNDNRIKKDRKINEIEIVESEETEALNKDNMHKQEKLSLLTDSSDCRIKKDEKLTDAENNETEKTETLDDSETEKNDLEELTHPQDQEIWDFKIDDTVVVRYYQRKQWKCYIGFIKAHVLDKDNETLYKIRFLKTVKNPNLKFLATKKLDIDVVPRSSIVKRVNLVLQSTKEYFLENNDDNVYF